MLLMRWVMVRRGITIKVPLMFFIFGNTYLKSQTKWKIDESHSTIGFSVKHMMVSEVEGKFEKYEGNVVASKEDFSDAKVEMTIYVNSINTGNEKRDDHLKSEDFFDVSKYPTITFKSKKVEKIGNDSYKLIGDITIKGITKEIILDVKYNGKVKDPWGNTRAGFTLTGEINRLDFNLKWNMVLEGGGLTVGEKVKIKCPVEIIHVGQ